MLPPAALPFAPRSAARPFTNPALERRIRDLIAFKGGGHIRLKHPPTLSASAALNDDFADIIAGDPFHVIPPTPEKLMTPSISTSSASSSASTATTTAGCGS